MLEKALTGSKRYWAWIFLLLCLCGMGGGLWLYQLNEGLGVTGLNRDVSWGLYIAQFTFLVGVAASAVMVVLPYYLHDYKEFGKITILGEFLAIPACIMCMAFIVVDMGRPDRVVYMFMHASPNSVMFWDTVVLSGYLGLNIVIGWTMLTSERKGVPAPKWVKPLIYLSIPWAVSIHTVTAFLYQGLPGRGFWMTAIMAPRFLASAFAAGPSFLILMCLLVRRFTKFDPGDNALRKLGQIVTYAMFISVFFFLMEVFTTYYSNIPEHKHHFYYLFRAGPWWLLAAMWGFAALAVIGLVIMVNPRTRNHIPTLAVGAGCVFAASWLEKGLGLVIGGLTPNPMGKYTVYTPTLVEIGIAVAVWSFGMLILTVLYKVATGVKEEQAA
ncbi:MAG: sulfate reduction electron transfer complex DsrMKJOP subunit DsrP [bacterium]